MPSDMTNLAQTAHRRHVEPGLEVIDLADLALLVEVPDAPFTPTTLALAAHRLQSFRRRGGPIHPNLLREPFQTVAEVLHVPGRFAVTIRVGVRGSREDPRVESDIVVAGVGSHEVTQEVAAAQRQVEEHIGGSQSPFQVRRATLVELDWPRAGYGAFIRQQLLRLSDAPGGVDLPLRFSFPGPDAPFRLLRSLLAAGPGTDMFVTVTPTTLWAGEQAALEATQRSSIERPQEASIARDSATALDALLSYRTDLYVLQLLVVTPEPLTEVTLRSIASAITAPYDAEREPGSRVVARPERFIGGGFDIEPCRNTPEVLRWLGYALPWIGFRTQRELVDLVTSTELGFAFAWLADTEGGLPGIGEVASPAPTVAPGPATVELGRDTFGSPARLADGDRHLHTVIVGATGCGKTSLMVDLAVQDAEAGRGVVVVDPHGDLNARIAARLTRSSHDRTFCLDAASGALDHLNLLQLFPPGSDRQQAVNFALVDGLVADLNRDFAGPVFQRVMRRLLQVASLEGGTMLDVEHYLAQPEDLVRAATRTKIRELTEVAAEVADWSNANRAEMTTYVASKLEWLASQGLRGTFAEPTSSSTCRPRSIRARSSSSAPRNTRGRGRWRCRRSSRRCSAAWRRVVLPSERSRCTSTRCSVTAATSSAGWRTNSGSARWPCTPPPKASPTSVCTLRG